MKGVGVKLTPLASTEEFDVGVLCEVQLENKIATMGIIAKKFLRFISFVPALYSMC